MPTSYMSPKSWVHHNTHSRQVTSLLIGSFSVFARMESHKQAPRHKLCQRMPLKQYPPCWHVWHAGRNNNSDEAAETAFLFRTIFSGDAALQMLFYCTTGVCQPLNLRTWLQREAFTSEIRRIYRRVVSFPTARRYKYRPNGDCDAEAANWLSFNCYKVDRPI